MKPMSTLSFNGEDAFEIKDSEAREALDTLNTELDKSKREISEQIGVLERLQPDTAMVGHILEVDSVDETGKPLTYRAVENKPDIEVDDTLTQEGKAADAKATGEALKNISVDETLTLEEYQALSEEEKNSNKTFYIKDANIIDINNVAKTGAKHIAFDNTNTTLTSKEVQGALVEVDNKLEDIHDSIGELNNQVIEQNEKAREFISDIYDETKTYTVDSYCINDNKLYKCITETTGSFDGSCWKETSMTDELVTQATVISEQNKKIKYQKTQYSTIVILDDKIASINGAFNFPDSGDLEFVGHFPIPMNALFPIQVRDNTNGTFKYIYMNNQGILESYNGGCEAGHNYTFACCYNIVF